MINNNERFAPATSKVPPKGVPEDRSNTLELASDTATDPAVLKGLAHQSRNPEVLAALARNPSTPTKNLFILWSADPAAILENPIVFLWEFSKRDSSKSHLPKEVQFLLYQHLLEQEKFDPKTELVDPAWIEWHLRKGKLRFRLPLHILVRDDRREIRLALLEDCLKQASQENLGAVGFPHSAVKELCSDSRSDVREAFAEAIGSGWLLPEPFDMELISRMARTLIRKSPGNLSLREQIAKWPCLNAVIIEQLAVDASEEFLATLAVHPQASVQFHERLALHPSSRIRAAVASCTAQESLLCAFANDPSPTVRAGLAASRHLSEEIQRALYNKRDSRVLLALLNNHKTLPGILEAISRLPHLAAAPLIRQHPNTPPHVLKALPQVPCGMGGEGG